MSEIRLQVKSCNKFFVHNTFHIGEIIVKFITWYNFRALYHIIKNLGSGWEAKDKNDFAISNDESGDIFWEFYLSYVLSVMVLARIIIDCGCIETEVDHIFFIC